MSELRSAPFIHFHLIQCLFSLRPDACIYLNTIMSNCENETPQQSHEMKVSASVHTVNNPGKRETFAVNEINRYKKRKSNTYSKKQRKDIEDSDRDGDESTMSMSIVQLLHDFDKK